MGLKEAIDEAFKFGSHHKLIKVILEIAKTLYHDDLGQALEKMNRSWIEKPMFHYSKLPKQLHKSDFKLEYSGVITLLIKVVGLENSFIFEDWVFYVISQNEKGVNYHWARMINDNLDI